MAKKTIYMLFFTLLAFLTACEEYRLLNPEPKLVVEGWIRDGGYPVVFVTTTVPLLQERQELDSLGRYVLTWARVSISDGEDTVLLTGRVNSKYFLRNYFTTAWMRGKAGKTYTLTVDYKNFHATAKTTIPQPVRLDSLFTEPVAKNDSMFVIKAQVSPQIGGTGFYKFMVAEQGKDNDYLSSYLGLYTDSNIGTGAALPVYAPHRLEETNFNPHFQRGETVRVLFAAIDEDAYNFWSEFEHDLAFNSSPLFPANTSLPSNIQGGLGYWHGYGGTEYFLEIGTDTITGR